LRRALLNLKKCFTHRTVSHNDHSSERYWEPSTPYALLIGTVAGTVATTVVRKRITCLVLSPRIPKD